MGGGTQLGKVRGLGSAHHGSHHWLLQRFTAAGNLLTVLYLAFMFIRLPDLGFDNVFHWLGRPSGAIPVGLLIVSVFWHARLGLQVMIEDYVHNPGNRFAAIMLLNLAAFAGAATGLYFLLEIAMNAAVSNGIASAQAAAQAAAAANQGGGM